MQEKYEIGKAYCRTRLSALVIAVFLLTSWESVLAGGNGEQSSDSSRLRVVASTSIVGDVVNAIGAEKIHLEVLLAAGQNPHSFEPSPQDIIKIQNADIVFINGLNLEVGLMPYLEDIDQVHSVSENVSVIEDGDHDDADEEDHDEELGDSEDHDHDDEMSMTMKAVIRMYGLIRSM